MTALRDIIVVLDDSVASEIRLDIAVALAQQHGAHLTGLSALDLLMPTRPVVPPRGNLEGDTPPASPIAELGCRDALLTIRKQTRKRPKGLTSSRLSSGNDFGSATCKATGGWPAATSAKPWCARHDRLISSFSARSTRITRHRRRGGNWPRTF